MSMAIVAVGTLVVAAAGTAYQGYQANKANQQQRSAQREATKQAGIQADLADQANNKANRKNPNIAALLAGNTNSGGPSGTMLTGSGGVDPGGLLLGRNTLLGG